MNTIIYHSADFDGIFCREIAKQHFGPGTAEDPNVYIGWNFGDRLIPMPATGTVYILDLPPECIDGNIDITRTIWIDHHKTSIEKWGDHWVPGHRIDGVAACRIAWQWFTFTGTCPSKEAFLKREVLEPLAVTLAGEYDVWDHRGDGDIEFQFGLRSVPEIPWKSLLRVGNTSKVGALITHGRVSMEYARQMAEQLMESRSFLVDWEGLKFLCVNTGRFNSLTFASRDKPETGHDALLGFAMKDRRWIVSLYHAAHRKDMDLSEIAKKHGGGGHRGACGFTCDKLPFL